MRNKSWEGREFNFYYTVEEGQLVQNWRQKLFLYNHSRLSYTMEMGPLGQALSNV